MAGLFQNEYVLAILLIISFVFLAKFIVWFTKKVIFRFVAKTETDLDDKILEIVTPQVYSIIILIGTYLALRALTILESYGEVIGGLFFVLFVIFVAVAVSRVLRVIVLHFLHVQKKFQKAPQLVTRILSTAVYVVALLIILDYFEISITPLMATLGVGAVAVGLALQGTLSNLFAGMRVISDRQLNIGNFIELDNGISGFIEDIRWSSTIVKTLSNNLVVVPNSKIAESVITNYSMPEQEMSLVIQCGVSYKSNLEKVEKVTNEVAEKIQKTVPGAVRSFKPFIRYHTFGDSNINFSIILRVEKSVDKYIVTHEFMKALKARYDKEKIEISWPVRKIVKG